MYIELRDIYKYYGPVHANRGVTLEFTPGHIYGLLGENAAGKSTLMRILAGYSQPDSGKILLDGCPVQLTDPKVALAAGVGMLHQDPMDFPALRVYETFFLARPHCHRREAVHRLRLLGARYGLVFDPMARIAELTVEERQQVELLRLLDMNTRILILDNFSIGISAAQKATIFATLQQLAAEGRVVVMITHTLADAQALCDEVYIMRQGQLVGRLSAPFSPEEVLTLMFGEKASQVRQQPVLPQPRNKDGFVLTNATFAGDLFDLVGMHIRAQAGEILALTGLPGNGQELLLKGLAGLAPLKAGSMQLADQEVGGLSASKLRRFGVALVPAAHMEEGLFPDLTICDHLALAYQDWVSYPENFFRTHCTGMASRQDSQAGRLSVGQQKQLQLALIPDKARYILLEHPTKNLDLDFTRSIWLYLYSRVENGATIVFCSDKLKEILVHSHRVLVFHGSRLFADKLVGELNEKQLAALIMGQD